MYPFDENFLNGFSSSSDDFMKQTNEGYLCLFTVKNPSFPDYISESQSGQSFLSNSWIIAFHLFQFKPTVVSCAVTSIQRILFWP